MQIQIKKTNLIKLIKFSRQILLSNNKIYFVKESLSGEIISKSLNFDINENSNYLLFISREIKKELDKLSNDVKINFISYYENGLEKTPFISFNNIEIELIKVVIKYDK